MIVTIIVVSWNAQSLACLHVPVMMKEAFTRPYMRKNSIPLMNSTPNDEGQGRRGRLAAIASTQAHSAIILNSCSLLHECAQLVRAAAPRNDGLVPHYSRHCFSTGIRATSHSVSQSRRGRDLRGAVRQPNNLAAIHPKLSTSLPPLVVIIKRKTV